MSLHRSVIAIVAAALIPAAAGLLPAARADVVWNEGINGDLSSNPLTPTAVTFAPGDNTIIGTVSEPGGDLRDYLTFTLAPGQFLTALTLDAFSPDGASFQGINAGNTSFIPSGGTAGNFLGLEFVTNSFIGMDMLPLLADGVYGSTGFSIPLGPGTYSYVFQEVTPGESRSYSLTFSVVPEPSAGLASALVAGLLFATGRRRTRR